MHLKFEIKKIGRAFGLALFLFCARTFAEPPADCSENIQRDFSAVYLVLAGQGPQLAALGHAYILLTAKPGSLNDGVVYQYNIDMNLKSQGEDYRGVRGAWKLWKTYKNSPLVLSCENSASFLRRYKSEDRAQFLFKIKFAPDQIRGLVHYLEDQRKLRTTSNSNDYSLFSKNCLTLAISSLNTQIKDPALKIPLAWDPERGFRWGLLSSRQAVLANTPLFSYETFLRSPMIEGRPIVIRPMGYVLAETNLALLEHLKKLKEICGWSEEVYSSLAKYGMNRSTRETKAYLNFLSQKVCGTTPNQAAHDTLRSVLSLILVHVEDDEIKKTIFELMFPKPA